MAQDLAQTASTPPELPSGGRALTLVSHPLCPYVQRAAIALHEKAVPFTRIDIDLAAKPDWFLKLSPTGKTPMLLVGGVPLFESAAIVEYLDDTEGTVLHPADPLERARHRGWIQFASDTLDGIGALYNAPDAESFAVRVRALRARFERVEADLTGPWFAGEAFSLVDAAFAPVFRYFDVFDRIGDFGILTGLARVAAWRARLADRPSVRAAAPGDYTERLARFLRARRSHMSTLIAG
ncbi:glutathione S-transferase family protein [Frigidibacter sp. RF13]|uniref:glutathione S-transferase family protein n=1 Tax=Frigidibacter sp. RF13 TaxID=2997340 RepID=UPI002271F3FE|nr:glutathione S-transferase family protein [Frigidibacter sp. RF13]MCY1127060.1 glutathione S-transferase family protein [Frigidibacter sp. RF13]